MTEFYLAPTYRSYEVKCAPINENGKDYVIIDYKGVDKKVRCYAKPQAAWTTPGEAMHFGVAVPYFTEDSNRHHYEPCGGPSLAEEIGFNFKGYVWVAECYSGYQQQVLANYVKQNGWNKLKNGIFGIYCLPDEMPSIEGIKFYRVDKSVILTDDNTYRTKSKIWEDMYELRGWCPAKYEIDGIVNGTMEPRTMIAPNDTKRLEGE